VLRRYFVEAISGEKCVMTLTFEHPITHDDATGSSGDAAFDSAQDVSVFIEQRERRLLADRRQLERQLLAEAQEHAARAQQADQQQPGDAAPAAANDDRLPQSPGGAGGGWVLAGATGEPRTPDLPLNPSPEHPPEAVVQAQLEALRDLDTFTAWRFVSLTARRAYGGTAERFAAALEAPATAALLMHCGAEAVLRRQRGAGRYSEVVRVQGVSGGEWCWWRVIGCELTGGWATWAVVSDCASLNRQPTPTYTTPLCLTTPAKPTPNPTEQSGASSAGMLPCSRTAPFWAAGWSRGSGPSARRAAAWTRARAGGRGRAAPPGRTAARRLRMTDDK
jgi:hypothetical protein